jgi:hypothetical protein
MKRNIRLMKILRYILIIMLFSICRFSIANAITNPDTSEFIFLDELQTGMKGEALTVVSGSEIDSFDVELLGIARDSGFNNRHFLLCKVSGDVIDFSGGIAAGMSGSPVYFDGRIAGAVSGHWEYTDQTIAIVTPIEYMLEELDYVKNDIEQDSSDSLKTGWANRESLKPQLAEYEINMMPSASSIPVDGKMNFVPATTPFYISGIEEEDIHYIKPLLDQFNNGELFRIPENFPANVKVQPEFKAGSCLSIPLCRGDINYGGFGTVTWVSKDGKYFVGFGHSMGRRGPCKIPAGTGYIYTTMKNRYRSGKLGVALEPIGVVYQDRGDAVAGVIGDMPTYIPLTVKVDGANLKDKITFRSEIIPSWDEYPSVASTAIIASITKILDGDIKGTLKTDLEVRIKFDDEIRTLNRTGIYTGNDVIVPLMTDLQGIFTRFRETEIKKFELLSIELNASYQPELLEGRIEGFEILKKDKINELAKQNSSLSAENNPFSNVESYSDPGIDKDDPEKYILKKDSTYLAAVSILNFRSPREIVYVPVRIPSDFPEGNGRITVRSASGEMPADYITGKDVAEYIKKWTKEGFSHVKDEDLKPFDYIEDIFKSNRSNVMIFEIVHEKFNPLTDLNRGFVYLEFERKGAVKGIWEKPVRIEKDKKKE